MNRLRRPRSFPALVGTLAAVSVATIAFGAFWPLTGATVTHDPAITKEGQIWWVFETGAGLPVKYSFNGTEWNQGVSIFGGELPWWRTYSPNMGTNDVWAPGILRFRNRSYLYYAVSQFGTKRSAIGLVSASSILAGDWRDDGVVVATSDQSTFNAIDPFPFVDPAGNPWLSYGSWFGGIALTRLDPTTMKPTGSTHTIAKRNGGIENSAILYRGGYYYLFVSIDLCCQGASSTYKIAYGRSSSITGPYLDKNGFSMSKGGGTVMDAGNSAWRGPGGQSVFRNGTGWVIARHAYESGNGVPRLLINDLRFDANGWPMY